MTKAELVDEMSRKTGYGKITVLKTVESFMETVKDSLADGENVYLRGFGSMVVKKKGEKKARDISKSTTIIIPAHHVPSFKPSKEFLTKMKIGN